MLLVLQHDFRSTWPGKIEILLKLFSYTHPLMKVTAFKKPVAGKQYIIDVKLHCDLYVCENASEVEVSLNIEEDDYDDHIHNLFKTFLTVK